MIARPDDTAPDPAPARLRCPRCGNSDSSQFVVLIPAWFNYADRELEDEPDEPDQDDPVECAAKDPDGQTCEYRAQLFVFEVHSTGGRMKPVDHSEELGGRPPRPYHATSARRPPAEDDADPAEADEDGVKEVENES